MSNLNIAGLIRSVAEAHYARDITGQAALDEWQRLVAMVQAVEAEPPSPQFSERPMFTPRQLDAITAPLHAEIERLKRAAETPSPKPWRLEDTRAVTSSQEKMVAGWYSAEAITDHEQHD